MSERERSISVGMVGGVGNSKRDKGTICSDLLTSQSDKSDGGNGALPTDPTNARLGRMQKTICAQGGSDNSDPSDQTRSGSGGLRDALRAVFAFAEVADVNEPCSAGPWRNYFEERAAIREYDGGLSRADAEAGALADCMARWRALNPPAASRNDACVHCGKARPDTPVLADGGHAWLHRACWAAMNAARDETARRAVEVALGLPSGRAGP